MHPKDADKLYLLPEHWLHIRVGTNSQDAKLGDVVFYHGPEKVLPIRFDVVNTSPSSKSDALFCTATVLGLRGAMCGAITIGSEVDIYPLDLLPEIVRVTIINSFFK